MSQKENELRCRNCRYPVLRPVLSDYCTNCGQLTGIPRDYAHDPNMAKSCLKYLQFFDKSYKFYKDKFVIYRRSRELEEIPYSSLKDCDVEIRSDSIYSGESEVAGGPAFWMTITLTLKGYPERQIRFKGNPMNARLESDLAFWLNPKVAENESESATRK